MYLGTLRTRGYEVCNFCISRGFLIYYGLLNHILFGDILHWLFGSSFQKSSYLDPKKI